MIQRRIKKIETRMNASRFCECFRFNEYFDFRQSGGEPARYYRFMPDTCRKCGKVIDKSKETEFLAFQKIADERLNQIAERWAKYEDCE
jgi:hypothetical protein